MTMKAALINSKTREVANLIVADPAHDKAPDGFEIVGIEDDSPVGNGWLYSRDRGFFMGAELKGSIEAERIAAWNSPDAVESRSIEKNADAFLDSVEVDDGR
jgi:hypothetical protein